ncbi:MAG: hypothetical protein PVG49_19510 [Desulfobacteraceae bacterium]|jgi:hypothetical protein
MNDIERERHVDTLMAIFDLKIHHALCLDRGVSTRVLFHYDRDLCIRRFKVLNRNITEPLHTRIMTWLEENVLDHDLIGSLSANEMDADTLSVTAHETVSFSSFGAPGKGVSRGTPKPPEKPLTRI